MDVVSLTQLSPPVRAALLRELGFEAGEEFVLQGGKPLLDRYTQEPVRVDRMLILPGSAIVLDDNPFSIASYLEEFGDAF
jgi:hypothetical protein